VDIVVTVARVPRSAEMGTQMTAQDHTRPHTGLGVRDFLFHIDQTVRRLLSAIFEATSSCAHTRHAHGARRGPTQHADRVDSVGW
jgi:hypothetical protein